MIQNHSPNLEELLEKEERVGEEEEKEEIEQFGQKHSVNLFKRRHSVAPQHPVNSQLTLMHGGEKGSEI